MTRRCPCGPRSAVALGASMVLAALTVAQPLASSLLIAAGAALLVPALKRLAPAGTFRARPGLPAAVLTRGLLTFAFFAGDAYIPLILTSIRHTSTDVRRVTLTVSTVAWTAGAWVQARAIARRGPRLLIASGLVLIIAGLVAMASLLWTAVPIWVAPVAWTVAGFGIGVAYSPISVTALALAKRGEEGRVSASVQLSDVLGTAFGTGRGRSRRGDRARRTGPIPGWGLAWRSPVAVAVARLGLAVTPRLPRSAAARPNCQRHHGKRRLDLGVGRSDERNSRNCRLLVRSAVPLGLDHFALDGRGREGAADR